MESYQDPLLSFCRDHRVLGRPTLPGMVGVEMALATAHQSTGEPVRCLRQIEFHRPVTLGGKGAASVALRVELDEGGTFRLVGRSRDETDRAIPWTVHLTGRLIPSPEKNVGRVVDLAALRARCGEPLPIDEVYAWYGMLGLEYGPGLRVIASAQRSEDEVLCRLVLPEGLRATAGAYHLHPSLADAALQAVGCLAWGRDAGRSALYLPTGLEEIRLFAPLPPEVFCHGRARIPDLSATETLRGDATILAPDGRVLAELRGITAKRVPLSSKARALPRTVDRPVEPAPGAWFYRGTWRERPLARAGSRGLAGPWIVFRDEEPSGLWVSERLRASGLDVIEVKPGDGFQVDGSNQVALDPGDEGDFRAFWRWLSDRGGETAGVVYLWGCRPGTTPSFDLAEVDRRLDRCLGSLFRIVRTRPAGRPLPLWLVTAGAQAVGDEPVAGPVEASLWGMARGLALECPDWQVRCVDLPGDADAWLERLLDEFQAGDDAPEVALRGGKRWVPELIADRSAPASLSMKERGVYVIAGGLGGLGLAVAGWLASTVRGRLVLLTRRAMPGRDEWDGIVAAADPGHPMRGSVLAVLALEQLGADVRVVEADIADPEAVRRVVAETRQDLGRIDGVFQCAGVLRDSALRNKSWDDFEAVLGPKVGGTLALDRALADDPPELFVLFSSIVGLTGNPGQADYAAASRFLDAFASWRTDRGHRTVSIAWGPWGEVGMAADIGARLRALGIVPFSPAQGIAALRHALALGSAQVVAVDLRPGLAQRHLGITLEPAETNEAPTVPAPRVAEKPTRDDLQAALRGQFSRLLEIEEVHIDPQTDLRDLGMDSILAMQLLHQFAGDLDDRFSPTLLFDFSTLEELSTVLHEKLDAEQLQRMLATLSGRPPVTAALPPASSTELPEAVEPAHVLREPGPIAAPDREGYAHYGRPDLVRRFEAVRLAVAYARGRGDRLWYEADGRSHEVLDLVGGFGSTLLGHHHEELVRYAQGLLEAGIPYHAQGSVRGHSGRLCRELSRRLEMATGRDYVATLCSTGTEAVEAALRHAHYEYHDRLTTRSHRQERDHALILHAHRDDGLGLDPSLLDQLNLEQGAPQGWADLVEALERRNRLAYEKPPVLLALRRAFHGRTAGAALVTYPGPGELRLSGDHFLSNEWLDPGDVAPLRERVLAHVATTQALRETAGSRLIVENEAWCRVAAVLVEPVQGEAGVRPIAPAFLAELRALADEFGFPIVVDEIQAGMGRCGSFTASERLGFRGDYYTFGKSLGGGLSKVTAMLVERGRYRPKFGRHFTSTFGEDDPSSLIALKTLEILDRDQLPARAGRIGIHLLEQLNRLRRRYPDVLADVRGFGCMVGVELVHPAGSASAILRSAGSHLGVLVAGFLLHEHGIRILPTTSDPLTLRLEPSAYLAGADIDRFADALEHACLVIRNANGGRLLRYLVTDRPAASKGEAVADWRDRQPRLEGEPRPDLPQVGFLMYFVDAAEMVLWDPSLLEIPADRHETLIRAFHQLAEPGVIRRPVVESSTGEAVQLNLFGFLLTSRMIEELMVAGDLDWLIERVEQAIEDARALGCRMVGLGGHLSIITQNCRGVATSAVGLTTGNALTVGVGCESIRTACRDRGIALEDAPCAVIGAGGNIGSTYARILADETPSMLLVGRTAQQSSVLRLAETLCADAITRLREAPEGPSGLARSLAEHPAWAELRDAEGDPEEVGRRLWKRLSTDDTSPLRVTGDLNRLRDVRVIVSGSNAAEAIVLPEHIGDRPVVLCDIAVPPDVADAVTAARPLAQVIRGGVVRLPVPQLNLKAGGLPDGCVYACVAETMLLGLAGHRMHFSFGAIQRTDVDAIMELARRFGFTTHVP